MSEIKKDRLTIEEVREFKDFENISDEEAQELIDFLYELSILTYKIFEEEYGKS